MKTILCYGDSLTWGYDPSGPGRHAFQDRWPSALKEALGKGVRVIAEGLNGRTTAFDDFAAGSDRNGARILPTILMSHSPLELVVIMLGTNDMKPFLCGKAIGAKQGMRRLIDIVRGHDYPMGEAAPAILIVSPPPSCETDNPDFSLVFEGALEESAKLARLYDRLAEEAGTGFFDAGSVAHTSPLDGVHLDADNTRAIGAGLAPIVKDMLGL
ncbi:lipolytic protein G-D-S-L [Nitratireductor indicus C115]|uniref:Lipolytic protein G-D-S-L n=1 Tax=Nitratireductor indicus C115 TaxID=1231190 RepID=K2PRJ3_9HYPH|nr:SGNH/GDSL hydrolase family protein [Nitratireductor indicus]EKF43662.1 lipolytic protein G-D-S-L [Nitratireductor indicus C115]SFQ79011.1 Lysophospholipase L1 [Nitratireductor indicus]